MKFFMALSLSWAVYAMLLITKTNGCWKGLQSFFSAREEKANKNGRLTKISKLSDVYVTPVCQFLGWKIQKKFLNHL